MDRLMNQVRVHVTKDDLISIEALGCGGEVQGVWITADQADAVAAWLLEAKAEIESQEGESRHE